MIKRLLFLLVTMMLGQSLLAQNSVESGTTATDTTSQRSDLKSQLLFGYLSYEAALQTMPQLTIVRQQMSDLRQQYDEELKRVEDEFNQKYEAFLEGRKDFPRTILLKRQTELQELLKKNIEFKTKSQQELQKAEQEAMAPLYKQLNEAIAAVARQFKLALVVNTDANACPFIEPTMGMDISTEVIEILSE